MKAAIRILLISLISFSLPSFADRAGFHISNEFVEIFYRGDLNGSLAITPSFIHSDVDGVRSDIVSMGIFATHKTPIVEFHFGGQPYLLYTKSKTKSLDAYGISIGGGVDVYFHPKIFAGGSLFYAPDILTGSELENFLDTSFRVGFKILPNADLYLGYRYIEGSQGNFDAELYDNGFLGFRVDI